MRDAETGAKLGAVTMDELMALGLGPTQVAMLEQGGRIETTINGKRVTIEIEPQERDGMKLRERGVRSRLVSGKRPKHISAKAWKRMRRSNVGGAE